MLISFICEELRHNKNNVPPQDAYSFFTTRGPQDTSCSFKWPGALLLLQLIQIMQLHQKTHCTRRWSCITRTTKPRAALCIFSLFFISVKILKMINKLPRGPTGDPEVNRGSQMMLWQENRNISSRHDIYTLARTKQTVFSHIVLWVPATTRWQQSSFIKSEGVTEELWQCIQQEQVDGGTGAAEGVVLLTLSSEKVNELVSLVYESHPQACKQWMLPNRKNPSSPKSREDFSQATARQTMRAGTIVTSNSVKYTWNDQITGQTLITCYIRVPL